MNTDELKNKLLSVVGVLNNIEIKGKTNLLNLGGCIAIIEDICQELTDYGNQSLIQPDDSSK